MTRWQNDSMLDAALIWIRDRITMMTVCSAQPGTYTSATTTSGVKLADVAMTSTAFTIGDGDTSGRKGAVQAKSSVTIDASGTASHVALCGSTGSALLYVTVCTTQALTTGNTVNFPTWDIEIADASSG